MQLVHLFSLLDSPINKVKHTLYLLEYWIHLKTVTCNMQTMYFMEALQKILDGLFYVAREQRDIFTKKKQSNPDTA